ncbi:HAMP domain-containing protein [Cellulomonas humilata]|uniref:histidine kinase n=1 Tax=Cellulomonas humilata TaxID=144055 RepID=A0A7Y5ZZV7_9CELL|nr:HAMP domain-containing sensor histidine kinase [Cellulomonas humilata]NUU15859.1 HAMP domain-containing protein [Cellulomonas humilata]
MNREVPRRAARWSLATRLQVGSVLVLTVGALTAATVVALVGPPLFHEHLMHADLRDQDEAILHAEEAFRYASAIALAVAIAAAALASIAVSLVFTRRIGRSLSSLSDAAARVGSGRYDARVAPPEMGPELDEVAVSFNHMAERLQDSDRLRERLLADVAHEVRTPVATITAYLEAVEDGVRPLDATTIELLREQALRLTRISEDLAAVTQAESGDLELEVRATAPADLVSSAVGAGRERAAESAVHLEGDVQQDLPGLEVDPLRMAQVLDNLVSNAIRHTPAGGRVTVAAGRTSDGGVRFSVTDTGDGIASEHLPHVFERFYRVDTARDRGHGGSGIGLAISLALAHAHGGTITAASPGPGKGSTFTVLLPR